MRGGPLLCERKQHASSNFTMQILSSALLAAALAAQAIIASPMRARSPYAVKETHYAPREWTKLERANGGSLVQLQIGLKQGKMDELLRHLDEGKDCAFHNISMV